MFRPILPRDDHSEWPTDTRTVRLCWDGREYSAKLELRTHPNGLDVVIDHAFKLGRRSFRVNARSYCGTSHALSLATEQCREQIRNAR